MSEDDDRSPGAPGRDGHRTTFSLRRWSQRKHATAREARSAAREQAPDASPPAIATTPSAAVSADPVVRADAAARVRDSEVAELPPIETLTIDSDFAPFMRAGVDPDLRREALKKLLHDPRFNVMDGLDVYIDDYTKTRPIDPSLARKLVARLHPRIAVGDDEATRAAVADAAVAEVGVAHSADAEAAVADPAVADPAVANSADVNGTIAIVADARTGEARAAVVAPRGDAAPADAAPAGDKSAGNAAGDSAGSAAGDSAGSAAGDSAGSAAGAH